MRRIADADRLADIAQFAINDAGDVGASARLGQEGEAEAGPDQALDALPGHLLLDDLWAIPGRGRLRDDEVMKLGARIPPAEKDSLFFQVDPL
jgi:hypothetical protein